MSETAILNIIYCANKKCRKDCTPNRTWAAGHENLICCSTKCLLVVMGEVERQEWLKAYPPEKDA